MVHCSINRNIVECKDEYVEMANRGEMGINRNIVECKEILNYFFCKFRSVLIETLWNVKDGSSD